MTRNVLCFNVQKHFKSQINTDTAPRARSWSYYWTNTFTCTSDKFWIWQTVQHTQELSSLRLNIITYYNISNISLDWYNTLVCYHWLLWFHCCTVRANWLVPSGAAWPIGNNFFCLIHSWGSCVVNR